MVKKNMVLIAAMIGGCMSAFALDGGNSNLVSRDARWRNAYVRQWSQRDTVGPVKIQLEKTSVDSMVVLFISDTARETREIPTIFNKDYGELMRFSRENNLTTKKFLAWYYSTQPPWKMDVAV